MITYDIHVHTCLSADADDNMTPDKVIEKAIENGLDIIAVTDHNSVKNIQAAYECAEDRIAFVPGVEIESSEEVHMLCLFPDLSSAYRMEKLLMMNLTDKKNKPEKLGHQYIYDVDLGKREEKALLRYPSRMTIEEIIFAAKQMRGVALYAHLENKAYSALSVLGMLPEWPKAKALEFTNNDAGRKCAAKLRENSDQCFLFSSDAHRLEDINTKETSGDLEEFADVLRNDEGRVTPGKFIEWLRSFDGV